MIVQFLSVIPTSGRLAVSISHAGVCHSAVWIFYRNISVDGVKYNASISQKHMPAILGVLVRANIGFPCPCPRACHDGQMKLPPHGRAMPQMILPIHIYTSVLARHDLLVTDGLHPAGIHKPL